MSQLFNHIRLTEETATPAVGMGATVFGYTDRNPYTIIAVSPSGKTITLQADAFRRVDENGMSEDQRYEITPNPQGYTTTARLTAKGWRIGGLRGEKVAVGVRSAYYDFSF